MASALDLMKQWAISGGNLSNESPLANQFMNVLSQQQAQKARENQMMQQFLMDRRLREEDFNRKVEFAKMFQQENKNKLSEQDQISKKMSSMRKEEKDLYQLHDYVTNQTEDIERVINVLDSDAFQSAQKKIKQRMSSDNILRKNIETLANGFNSKQNPSANDIDKIATEVNNLIRLNDFTDEEASAVNMVFNAIKGTTASILKNRGIKAGAQMMKTALSGKGSTFLQSPEALKQSFENLIPEFNGIYKTAFESRSNALKKDPNKEYSITQNDDFNPYKFEKKKRNDLDEVAMMLKEAMDSGEDELSEDEQAYFDYGLSKGASEEEIMQQLAKNRKGK